MESQEERWGWAGEQKQWQVFGSLECSVLQDGESGQDRQQGLAPGPSS